MGGLEPFQHPLQIAHRRARGQQLLSDAAHLGAAVLVERLEKQVPLGAEGVVRAFAADAHGIEQLTKAGGFIALGPEHLTPARRPAGSAPAWGDGALWVLTLARVTGDALLPMAHWWRIPHG